MDSETPAAVNGMLHITACLACGPRHITELRLQVPQGTTVAQALTMLHWDVDSPDTQGVQWCIWGKLTEPTHVLREQDRIEGVRPLKVDPKVARRERFKGQGSKAAGLFASRRAGAKPGY
jgi:putative ubiquitin-RnfH superfamily antitoxin RatB of RatAB toxin-antitoxin module